MSTLTYSSLVTDVLTYSERNDDQFTAQIPRFVMLAENRIATALKILGFQTVVKGSMFIDNPIIAKPVYWKAWISLNLIDPATQERHEIRPRSYEYLRSFWPKSTKTARPIFYSDYNVDNVIVAPTPDTAYEFEMIYYARLTPMTEINQKNWMSDNAPQLLFYATMMEAQVFLKNESSTAYYQGLVNEAIAALNGEDKNRQADRTQIQN